MLDVPARMSYANWPNRIHVIGGSASAGDVGSFGVGVKGLEVMDVNGKGKNDIYSKTVFRFLKHSVNLKTKFNFKHVFVFGRYELME